MVWVWPPHTSMNRYWRPGSHSRAIRAASARAFAASRYSSTNRTRPPLGDAALELLDAGVPQGVQLVGVRLTDAGQETQRRPGLRLIQLGHREPDVDQDPVTRPRRLVGQQPDVHRPAHPADLHPG